MSSNGRGCVVVVVVFFFTEQKDAAEGWKRRILNCAVASGSRPTMAGGEQDGRQLAKPLKLNGSGVRKLLFQSVRSTGQFLFTLMTPADVRENPNPKAV